MKPMIRLRTAALAIVLLAFGVLAIPMAASARVIVVTDSIQNAVDAANSGDTIVVPPAIYRETVLVDKDDVTIRGSRGAVIDATGFEDGIRVGTGEFGVDQSGFRTCPGPETLVRNFTLDGLTIRNAEENGIFLINVDGFRLTGGRYVDNGEYGPFPVCSRNGRIDFNQAEGHNDAAIYVGDDDNVVVTNNHVTRSVIGVEIENSTNAVVRNNKLKGNTAGIFVVVLPGLPMALTDNVLIEDNEVIRNNFPNPITDPTDVLAPLPTGTGIANVGGDRVVIRDNRVIGNDSVGIAVIANPFAAADPRIEPFPDANEVRDNVVLQNGKNPDPVRATTPGVDIAFDGTGIANCFDGNIFKTEFPEGITGFFPCP